MAVEVLASLIGLEEDNFINFRTRLAEFRTQLQLRIGKQAITTNLDELKSQKKDQLTLRPPVSISSAILKGKDFPRSQRS